MEGEISFKGSGYSISQCQCYAMEMGCIEEETTSWTRKKSISISHDLRESWHNRQGMNSCCQCVMFFCRNKTMGDILGLFKRAKGTHYLFEEINVWHHTNISTKNLPCKIQLLWYLINRNKCLYSSSRNEPNTVFKTAVQYIPSNSL